MRRRQIWLFVLVAVVAALLVPLTWRQPVIPLPPPATSVPTARPAAIQPPRSTVRPTPAPTTAPAVGSWTLRGTGRGDDVQLAEGEYTLVWSMDVVLPMIDPASFAVELNNSVRTGPSYEILDFEPGGVTARVASYSDAKRIGRIPAGRYYLEVITCDYCRWTISLWPR